LLRDDAGTHALLDRAARGEGPFSVHLLASERELGIWAALAGIPRGKTCTYAELAQQAGLPRGYARSVGTLLAGNKIALILPCHRVIPADGGAGKYRWGADLKADLLHTERR
ncbi:MAG: MGMT family protein, partial [Opitutales bacterium]